MSKLFLDDVRKPYDDTWDVVRSYDEFIGYILTNGVPDIISFDHDLDISHYATSGYIGEKIAYDGYDCARALFSYKLDNLKQVIVHSWNPDGARRIFNLFQDRQIPAIIKAY